METSSSQSYILAYYPSAMRSVCLLYSQTTAVLENATIRVPRILEQDCNTGLMLLEDVGSTTLYESAFQPWRKLAHYFDQAVVILQRIGELPVEAVSPLNAALGQQRLSAEIAQTMDLFLGSALESKDRGLAREFHLRLQEICMELGRGVLVPCHRDFMARNLVPLESPNELAVLDHQDLTLGPAFYDLASLLNDSLFPPLLYESGLLRRLGFGSSERTWYHRAAAQRTLKAVGTYHSFADRGFKQHLSLVPKTLGRALHHLLQLPETSALCPKLKTAWSPLILEEND